MLSEAARMLRFLFVDEASFVLDDDAAAKNLGTDAAPVLEAARAALDALTDWSAPDDRGGAEGGAGRRARAQAAQARSRPCGSP